MPCKFAVRTALVIPREHCRRVAVNLGRFAGGILADGVDVEEADGAAGGVGEEGGQGGLDVELDVVPEALHRTGLHSRLPQRYKDRPY